jgi:hypothetical protein
VALGTSAVFPLDPSLFIDDRDAAAVLAEDATAFRSFGLNTRGGNDGCGEQDGEKAINHRRLTDGSR